MNGVSRRWLLATAALLVMARADAAPADTADIASVERVQAFYDVLLDAMKHADILKAKGRYEKLAPSIQQTFDLAAMARVAAGRPFDGFTPQQQIAVRAAFADFVSATYAARFDGFEGERFEIDPMPEARGQDRFVKTKLVLTQGAAPVELNYLMRNAPVFGWRAQDIFLNGSISEMATWRSEYGPLAQTGGADALVDKLRNETAKLLSGF